MPALLRQGAAGMRTELNSECTACVRRFAVQCEQPLDISHSLPPPYADCAATMAHPKFAPRGAAADANASTTRFTFLDLSHNGTWQNVQQAHQAHAGCGSHAFHPA